MLGFLFSVSRAISASSHFFPLPLLSGGEGNGSWIGMYELKVCLATYCCVASYALSGAVRGQFALFASCLFPARLSRKRSSLQKTGKFEEVTRPDV